MQGCDWSPENSQSIRSLEQNLPKIIPDSKDVFVNRKAVKMPRDVYHPSYKVG